MTAVEYLVELLNFDGYVSEDTINKAKEMEKQQIIDAFWNGDNTDCLSEQNLFEFADKYYNETYNKTTP